MYCMISITIRYNLYDTHYVSYNLSVFTIYYYDIELFVYDTIRYDICHMTLRTMSWRNCIIKIWLTYDNIISDEGGISYLPKK